MKRGRSIQGKLRRRIVLVGLASFFVATLLSNLVWVPMLRSRALKTAKNGNEEITSRIDSTLEFIDNYSENLALSVQQNAAIQRYFAEPTASNQNIAMLSLSNLTSYEGIVRAVFLEMNDRPLLDSLSRICEADYELLHSQWYQDIRDSEFCRRLSRVYTVSINHVDYPTVAYARNFYLNNRWCTFVIFTSLNDTLYDVRTVGENNYDYFLLRDSTGSVFYTAGDETWAERTAAVGPEAGLSGLMEITGGTALTRRSVSSGWTITSFVSNSNILRSLMPYSLGLLMSLACLLLMMLIVLSTSLGKMLRPVVSLARTMDGAAKGNLEQKVEICSDDEIGLLQQSYNKMLDDLRRSIDLIAEKERTEQQIRFGLLVSQIDPHFLFNTLNVIQQMAGTESAYRTQALIMALSHLLRYSLMSNDEQVPLSREVRIVDEYYSIYHVRFGDRVQMQWAFSDSLDLTETMVPSFILQPIVENAFKHGICPKEEGGVVRIRMIPLREKGLLCIRVLDNGVGIEPEQLQQLRTALEQPAPRWEHIGIYNVAARLRLLDARCRVVVRSRPGRGTAVILYLPLVENEEEFEE